MIKGNGFFIPTEIGDFHPTLSGDYRPTLTTEALLTLAITISAELVVADPAILIGIFITSDLHYDVFIREITTNIKRPPGREKMYDLGAKMGVFPRYNMIKND